MQQENMPEAAMMYPLSESLQKALDLHPGEPLRLVDPRTETAYLLVRADEYSAAGHGQDAREAEIGLAPALRQAREAFLQQLPQLLADEGRAGWWAAFHGAQCLGVRRTPQELVREIQGRGIPAGECYLGVIRPHDAEPEEVEPRHAHHFEQRESHG